MSSCSPTAVVSTIRKENHAERAERRAANIVEWQERALAKVSLLCLLSEIDSCSWVGVAVVFHTVLNPLPPRPPPLCPLLLSFSQAQKATTTKSSSSSSSAASVSIQQNLPNKILFVENLPVEVTGNSRIATCTQHCCLAFAAYMHSGVSHVCSRANHSLFRSVILP